MKFDLDNLVRRERWNDFFLMKWLSISHLSISTDDHVSRDCLMSNGANILSRIIAIDTSISRRVCSSREQVFSSVKVRVSR